MKLIVKHSDILTRDALESLVLNSTGDCLSIYMPTHRSGNESQQDPLRLKNLLRSAETQLLEHGFRTTEARELIAPAEDLLEDSLFWSYQSDGLALFLGPDSAYAYRLPIFFEEIIRYDRTYLIRPLLPIFYGDGRYYVLVLSKSGVRLLQCSRFTFSEIELGAEASGGLQEILDLFDFEKSIQWRETSAGVPGQGSASSVFHGHGAQSDDANMKPRLVAYLKKLDEIVNDRLNGERSPMVVASVDYIRAMYSNASHYDGILKEGIDGNSDSEHDENLVQRAWRLVQPSFENEKKRSVDRLNQFLGSGDRRGTTNMETIVAQAWSRLIETLFVPVGYTCWGRFDPDALSTEIHPQRAIDDQDLLNLACIWTLQGGGTLHECPADAGVAAILR